MALSYAIIVTEMKDANLVLPPFHAIDGDYGLATYEKGKLVDGCGFSAVGNIPETVTGLVMVVSSKATMDLIAADPRFLMLDRFDPAVVVVRASAKDATADDEIPDKDISKAQEKAVKDWLKAMKHKPSDVDKKEWKTYKEELATILELHKVTWGQYQLAYFHAKNKAEGK